MCCTALTGANPCARLPKPITFLIKPFGASFTLLASSKKIFYVKPLEE
jgi:hypothetical protein